MTKEEALIKVKENLWFLKGHPEWNRDKEVVLAAVQKNGYVLEYASIDLRKNRDVVLTAVKSNGDVLKSASEELKNNREVVMAAVQQDGNALSCASEQLKNDHEVVLLAVKNNKNAIKFSNLKGYKNWKTIVKKESEDFLFSCWNNRDEDVRLQVAIHHNFLPTLEQIKIGLKDLYGKARNIYQLRQDEWLAKIEENKLRNTV